MNDLYSKLKEFGKVKANEPLAKHTTYKIGGPAKFLVIVESTDKLVELVKFLNDEGENYVLLGGGSNTLARDEGYEGVVIKVQSSRQLGGQAPFRVQGSVIEAEAGVMLAALVSASVQAGLAGLEWAVGIPGTIGGATFGNAGAMGSQISDNIEKVEVWRDGEILQIPVSECEYKYKDSIFKHNNDVILRVWLKLQPGDKAELTKKIMDYVNHRNTSHPEGCGNAGCTFKNYVVEENKKQEIEEKFDDEKVKQTIEKYGKVPVGRLIDLVGMRGVKRGGAVVSEQHGNFILNVDNASADDILSLIAEVKDKVYNKFGIEVEEEIQII